VKRWWVCGIRRTRRPLTGAVGITDRTGRPEILEQPVAEMPQGSSDRAGYHCSRRSAVRDRSAASSCPRGAVTVLGLEGGYRPCNRLL
jgi:hypothetical protein